MARKYLEIHPIGTSARLALHDKRPVVGSGQRVAEMADADSVGWLTLLPSGRYVHEGITGAIRPLDLQRVEAGLKKMVGGGEAAADPAQLADDLKRWRRGGRDDGSYLFDASRAAQLLGMPTRTYEGIEQGRGFRYPKLLHLALKAFG